RDAFTQAERRLTAARDAMGLAALELHRGHLDRAAGREDAVAARLAAGRALCARSAQIRLAIRLLEACRAQPASGVALTLGPGASWFQLSEPPRVDLSRRSTLRRLLHLLADARVRAPGKPLGTAELLATGWPGERVSKDAGANRVHVAIGTLRRLGLDGVL